jgi:hypothetical protein
LVDWDGDGLLDILVGNIRGEVHWLRNEGTKTQPKFGGRIPIRAGDAPLNVGGDAHPIAVDWDGDGVLDLLVGAGDGCVYFCKGKKVDGQKMPELEKPVPLTAGRKKLQLGSRTKIAVCDWNGDGKLDLLVGNFGYHSEAKRENAYVGNVYVILRR